MSDPAPAASPAGFPPTMWSAIVSARGGDPTEAQRALERLARAYWQPLYHFVRRAGRGHEEARDLTQGFFLHLLSRDFLRNLRPEAGRFRGFLVRALQRWLRDQRERAGAEKRGGGTTPLSLDELPAGVADPTDDGDTPERAFDRQWAREIVARALVAVERRWENQAPLFAALRPTLDGHAAGADGYAGVGARLGLTESAVKSAALRLRQDYAGEIRAEVRATVADPAEVDDEIRHLVRLLRE